MGPISYERMENAPWSFSEETVEQMNQVLAVLGSQEDRVNVECHKRLLASRTAAVFIARDESDRSNDTLQGRIVGIVVVNIMFMPDGAEARIDDVTVLDGYRGKGIARQLMERAMGFAKLHRADDVELTCAPHREAAGKLYENLGFKQRKTRVYSLALKE